MFLAPAFSTARQQNVSCTNGRRLTTETDQAQLTGAITLTLQRITRENALDHLRAIHQITVQVLGLPKDVHDHDHDHRVDKHRDQDHPTLAYLQNLCDQNIYMLSSILQNTVMYRDQDTMTLHTHGQVLHHMQAVRKHRMQHQLHRANIHRYNQ